MPSFIGHPDRFAVGAAHLLVDVDDRLHEVVARRNRRELDRIADARLVDDHRLAGPDLLDVEAEDRGSAERDRSRGSGCAVFDTNSTSRPVTGCDAPAGLTLTSKRGDCAIDAGAAAINSANDDDEEARPWQFDS